MTKRLDNQERKNQKRKRGQRETYGNGSVSPVMVNKLGKDGKPVIGSDGKPVKVQKKDKQGRPVWNVCISLGTEEYTDAKGRRRRRQRKAQKVFHGSLEDARKLAKELSDGYASIDAESVGMTFSDVCAAWVAWMKTKDSAAERRLKDYERRLSYLAEALGDKPIIEIKAADVESALIAAKAHHDLSQRTLKEVHALAKRVFKYAVTREWALRNPVEAIDSPKAEKHVERKSLTPEECARLRACLDDDELAAYEEFDAKEKRQHEWDRTRTNKKTFTRSMLLGLSDISGLVAVRLMLATGMRRGEALALSWEHIDFDAREVKIVQSLDATGKVKPPKSAAGVRSLHVDADTIEHLKSWKAFQKKALGLVMTEDADGRKVAVGQSRKTPVCCNDAGGRFGVSNFSRWWRGWRVEAGFPSLLVHELRHTQATLLLGNHIDVKTVQTRLGHADASLTLNQYAHAIPARDEDAAAVMASIYSAPVEPTRKIATFETKTA